MGDRRWSPPKPKQPGRPAVRKPATADEARVPRLDHGRDVARWTWCGSLWLGGRVVGQVTFGPAPSTVGEPEWATVIDGKREVEASFWKCMARVEAEVGVAGVPKGRPCPTE